MSVQSRVRFTDLGPFRAIRYTALLGLQMDDTTYGWTVQMQTRAVRLGLRCTEVPVSYHRRIGTSKVSGTLRGVWGAGTCIIRTIFQEALRRRQPVHRVIVFARYPQPGTTKTRVIPALGPEGAANLHRQMVHIALHTATIAAARTAGDVEVRFTGGSAKQMSHAFGPAALYREQASGDLGARMHQALTQAFAEGVSRAAVIGTDCPRLSADILATSLERLTDHDLVLGPAQDGGYYLIAMRRPIPELFAGIDWDTPQVRTQTLAIAQTLGLKVHLLPILPYGDQALFMSARLYAQVGGFPDMPSMEDYALVRTLARHHPIRILPATATSSARRWLERGILRTTGQYQWQTLMYHLRRLLYPSSLVQ